MLWMLANPVAAAAVLAAIGVLLWAFLPKRKPETETQPTPIPTDLHGWVDLTKTKIEAAIVRTRAFLDSLLQQVKQRQPGPARDPLTQAMMLIVQNYVNLSTLGSPEAKLMMAQLEQMAGPMLLPLMKSMVIVAAAPNPVPPQP